MNEKEQIEDLVTLLDNFVQNGGGHMNVSVNGSLEDIIRKTDIFRSLDCSSADMPCKVPTLHNNIDEE